jgi:hypothetical protein
VLRYPVESPRTGPPLAHTEIQALLKNEWVAYGTGTSGFCYRHGELPTPIPAPRGVAVLAAGRARGQAAQGFAWSEPLSPEAPTRNSREDLFYTEGIVTSAQGASELLRIVPPRQQVLLGQLAQKFAAQLPIEELVNELVRPVHDVDHEYLHLRIIESREPTPGNLSERCTDHDIGEVSSLRAGRDACMQIFQYGIAKTLLNEVLCESLLQNRVGKGGVDRVVLSHLQSEIRGKRASGRPALARTG